MHFLRLAQCGLGRSQGSNIASRFESSGIAGRVNVSHDTYMLTRDCFSYEERGEIPLKNKANMKAYFVMRER